MRKTSLFKRSMAGLLCFVLVLSLIPAMSWVAKAAEGDDSGEQETTTTTGPQGNFITLPITVRDFAADGMLFEYNEVDRATFTARNDDGSFTWSTPNEVTITDRLAYDQTGRGTDGAINHSYREPYQAIYNPTDTQIASAKYTGIFVLPKSASRVIGDWWYCLIIDANGNILKVLPAGDKSKTTYTDDMNANYTLPDSTKTTPAYSIWTWRNPENLPYYTLVDDITEENKGNYYFSFNTSTTAGATVDIYLSTLRGYRNIAPDARRGVFVLDGYVNNYQGYVTGIELSELGKDNYTQYWKILVIDTYQDANQVVDIIPQGENKAEGVANYLLYDNYPEYYSFVLVYCSNDNHVCRDTLATITDDNMDEYQIVLPPCSVGGALFIERTITMHEANTRGFGLLFTKASDMFHNLYDDPTGVNYGTIAGTLLEDNDPTDVPGDFETNVSPSKTVYIWNEAETVEDRVSQELVYGTIRTGLVTNQLDENTKRPVYTEATVEYLAKYMEKVMYYPESYNDNYYSFHVMGVKMFDASEKYVGPEDPTAVYDLAEMLRRNIKAANGGEYALGNYTDSQTKYNNGGLRTYKDVTTWYDAAYFLLHNTWSDSDLDATEAGSDGYGMPTQYHSLHLMETTNAQGQTCYAFNAKYANTFYENGEMYNTPYGDYTTANRPYDGAFAKLSHTEATTSGVKLPHLRFDPLGPASQNGWQGYRKAGVMNTYGELTNAEVSQDWSEYYDETNYHLSLEGHAQFVYQYDADQYFTFTGDDDVYLYINGFRVLDIGGAHGMSEVTININDVAKRIGLENGKTYSFDFFYMERHGTAANFGIETNIQIADPSMNTTKQGFQNGVNTGYGGPVNANNHVGYTFELENNGTAHLYDLTFNDPALGVYFGYDKIQPYPLDADENPVTTNHPYTIEDDLYLIYYNSSGEIVEYIKPGEGLTADTLKKYLADGLEPGEKLGIYGIKYKIKTEQWADTDNDGKGDTFINTVYTTATANGKTLNGVADWKVVKMEHPYEAFRVYDWVHKTVSNDPADAENLIWKTPKENGINVDNGVTVTKAELISKYLETGTAALTLSDADKAKIEIVQCTAAGNEDPYFFQNSKAEVNADYSITYTSDTVGKDTVFFKFKNVPNKAVYNSLVFSYEVYTYGAVDNIYVLDYGLDVELAGKDFGFHKNDHLQLNENNRTMEVEVLDMVDEDGKHIDSKDGLYGDFIWDSDNRSLKYKPDEIIDDIDYVYAKFRIMEKGTDIQFSKFTGVDMVQKITTAPASVMYYEEDFPGITYCTAGNNQWVHYETMVQAKDENGNPLYNEDGTPKMVSVAGTEQSADQESNYGSDPNYEEDKVGNNTEKETIVFTVNGESPNATHEKLISDLAKFLGLSGEDSNGTYNKLVVNVKEEVMSFNFRGTGFEIVSRTTEDKYALIQVKVYLMDNDGKNVVVNQKNTSDYKKELPATDANGVCRTKIVITESKGGDLYQVPIIAIKDLQRGQYKVTVTASYHQEQERVLYIDGIRIYGPLADDQALEYYSPEESGASYYEVKNLIAGNHAIYVDMTETDGEVELYTGGTLIENTNENAELVLTNKKPDGSLITLTDYLSFGPNNEIYLDGNNSTNLIAFFLVPDSNVSADQRTVQIGAHRKAEALSGYDGIVPMLYGSTADAITEGTNVLNVASGTEQYFTIDVDKLVLEDGKYLVMIAAGEGDQGKEVLALTNLKVKGYTIELATTSLYAANENGTLAEHIMVRTIAEILGAEYGENSDGDGSGTEGEADSENVNQNLEIINAALQSDAVASGKRASLAVSASLNAEEIEVLDAEGNLVSSTSLTRTDKDGKAVFTFLWRVYGSRGDKQVYTIRVKDAEGKYSVNTMTVTVTIK